MEERDEVKLHGMWASTYSKRVELALKVKGIPYEYIEEDLANKSPLLLGLNPVHKKVPVLVHNGKPVSESLVILEYIDESFKTYGPRLFPEEPYERAKVRFWASFIQELFESLSRVIATDGEEQKKEAKEMIEKHKVFESGVREFFSHGGPFTNGDVLGLLDILAVSTLGMHDVQQQVFGPKFLDPQETPFLAMWLSRIGEQPLVKLTSPPRDEIARLLQFVKSNKASVSV